MPQLTQDVVKLITLKVNIYTPRGIISMPGRIVGFSDRISSLLVPQEFMDWGNNNFALNKHAQPSRIIIRTKDPGNPDLVKYLQQTGLTTDADKTRFSKYRQVVTIVVNAGWITGAVMLIFALLIFTLFIQLTIASCKEEIQLLITLGASPKQLKRFLIKQFFPSNIIIAIVVLLLLALLQYQLAGFLTKQNIFVNTMLSAYTIMVAAIILLVLWIVNYRTIKKYIALNKE